MFGTFKTPITAAEVFTKSSQVGDVLTHMHRLKFDVTPVFASGAGHVASTANDPEGTLWRSDIEVGAPTDEVGSFVRPLTSSTLIDGNASLLELLNRFRGAHIFMLVVGSGGIEGIVTPSDLNKQAGRTHLFMEVSALELALADRVRTAGHADDELLGALPRDRASRARSLLARKQERDEAADLVAALDFQDLLNIERRSGGLEVLSALTDDQVRSLSDFRNSVMHAVLDPAGDDSASLRHLLSQTALVACLLNSLHSVDRALP